MTRSKLQFLSGSFRTIDYDEMRVDGPFLHFTLTGEPVLTATVANLCFYEPAPVEIPQERPKSDLFARY